MAIIDLKYATIVMSDGSSNTISVDIGVGNLTYDEKRNVEAVKRRGLLDTVRLGDEEMLEVGFQFVWEYVHNPMGMDPPTIEDVLKREGAASAWVSTSTDPEAPYCVDITVTYTPPCGGLPAETIVLPQFHYETLAHSLADATIDCKGKCNTTEAG